MVVHRGGRLISEIVLDVDANIIASANVKDGGTEGPGQVRRERREKSAGLRKVSDGSAKRLKASHYTHGQDPLTPTAILSYSPSVKPSKRVSHRRGAF